MIGNCLSANGILLRFGYYSKFNVDVHCLHLIFNQHNFVIHGDIHCVLNVISFHVLINDCKFVVIIDLCILINSNLALSHFMEPVIFHCLELNRFSSFKHKKPNRTESNQLKLKLVGF